VRGVNFIPQEKGGISILNGDIHKEEETYCKELRLLGGENAFLSLDNGHFQSGQSRETSAGNCRGCEKLERGERANLGHRHLRRRDFKKKKKTRVPRPKEGSPAPPPGICPPKRSPSKPGKKGHMHFQRGARACKFRRGPVRAEEKRT